MNTFKGISLWAIRIGLWIVPFIPLYVSRSLFFPFITGKAFLFRALIEVLFALWIILALFFPEYRPRKTPLLWAVGAFIAVLTLATIFGVNPYRSFWSNFERMEGLVAHLHFVAYFLVAAHVLRKKDWFVFFNLFLIAGLGQNIVAFLQKLQIVASPQGGFRTDGTIGNATYVAAYSLFVLGTALLLFLWTRVKALKWWYGIMIASTLLTIYFTATRGAILALLLGVIAAGALLLWRGGMRARSKRVIIAGLAIVVLAAVGVKVFHNSSFVKNSDILSRLSSISFKEGSSRFLNWQMGLKGFIERPLLGWGPEGYTVVFAKNFNPQLYTQEPWFDRVHNIVFDWLVSAGILGLLAYFSLFAAAFLVLARWTRGAKNEAKKERLFMAWLISILLLVYLFQNLFVFDQFTTYMSFFAFLAFIQSMTKSEHSTENTNQSVARGTHSSLSMGILTTISMVVIVGTAAAQYFVNYKPFAANKTLLEAYGERRTEGISKAFELYQKALAYHTLGRYEIREQLAQFSIAVLNNAQADNALKEKIFDEAITELKKGVKENPGDPRPYLFLGTLQSQAGLFEEGKIAFNHAIALSPQKQQIYFELADLYIREKNYSKAIEILEKAFRFAPKFNEARVNLAAVYILNGEQEKGDALLVEGFGKADLGFPILVQVYTVRKDYTRLLGVWKAYVASYPNTTEYRKNVAAVYLKLGKQKEAIATLEEIIRLDPKFAEEGNFYINEIKAGRSPQ